MTNTRTLEIPADLPAWRLREVERLRRWLAEETTATTAGVLLWNSNGRTVPPSCFADAFVELPAGQAAAHQRETAAFLAEYRASELAPDAEQLGEMRAAFGAGAVVVNVLSGRRIRL